MSIGENIKRLREAQNMTQEQLAEAINVSRSYIAQMERGSKVPSMYIGSALAKALKCTLDDIISSNTA